MDTNGDIFPGYKMLLPCFGPRRNISLAISVNPSGRVLAEEGPGLSAVHHR